MKKMKSMWGNCRDFSGGDGTHPVEPERLNTKKIFPWISLQKDIVEIV